jgi:hypothetical protein
VYPPMPSKPIAAHATNVTAKPTTSAHSVVFTRRVTSVQTSIGQRSSFARDGEAQCESPARARARE